MAWLSTEKREKRRPFPEISNGRLPRRLPYRYEASDSGAAVDLTAALPTMQNVAHRRTRHAKHPRRRGRVRGTKSRPSGERGSLSWNQACSAARSWSRSAPRQSAGYAADLAKGHPLARVSSTTRPARHRRGDHGARAGAQGEGRSVYRDLPIDGLDPQARNAAEAARCAHDQGKF